MHYLHHSLEPKLKSVKHSYLETWLNHHGLNDAQFYIADFYDGVVDQDRQRLGEDGKILVFTNGKKGYFTDRDTAKLMTESDRDPQALLFPKWFETIRTGRYLVVVVVCRWISLVTGLLRPILHAKLPEGRHNGKITNYPLRQNWRYSLCQYLSALFRTRIGRVRR